MRRRSGQVWSVRAATSADVGPITQLITQLGRDQRPHGLCAEGLLAGCKVLRLLSRDGVAVGLCGVEGPRSDGPRVSLKAIEFRMIVLIADGLDETAAAEASDRLIDDLACSMGLPIRSAAFRVGSSRSLEAPRWPQN